MAARAGARIINGEYVQFHPTALAVPGAEGFLISEAVRGEGGVLLTPDGHAFMEKYSPEWKDLASRDVVSRAIHMEMLEHNHSYVLLDIASHMDAKAIQQRFPNIYTTCLKAGIDISREPIPVVPAAHYFCGGVAVDDWGQASIANMYAVGEVSSTGLHGANRLGTNSLLDIIVFGRRGGIAMSEYASTHDLIDVSENAHDGTERWIASMFEGGGPEFGANVRATLQEMMMDNASVVRSEASLKEASHALEELRKRYDEVRVRDRSKVFNTELVEHVELGYLMDMAEALVVSALARTESRGGHYRTDHQLREDEHWLKHSFTTKTADGETRLAYKDVTLGRYTPMERKY